LLLGDVRGHEAAEPSAERDRILAAFMKRFAVKDLLSGEGTPDAAPDRGWSCS
jgi:hypothetical protein